MTLDYETFLATKLAASPNTGFDPGRVDHLGLFGFQRDLVTWALRRGRAALFADTGLGKTRMQLVWADHVQRHTGGRALILAPLSVAKQTVTEGAAIGVPVQRVSDGIECRNPGIFVTNYDKLHRFEDSGPGAEPLMFDAVVLDESSCIKSFQSKTLGVLLDRFAATPYKLCASATPSPNDYTELGTHAEFLGVCTRAEMLAEFFCHDGGDTSKWRLKGHARHAFWRWVSSWAALLRRPSDLGYDDSDYVLPPMHVHEHMSAADPDVVREAGLLFAEPASTLTERRNARKTTMDQRIRDCVELVQATPGQFVVWCALNAEQDELRRAFGDECASIQGADDSFTKELRYQAWADGKHRILVSKIAIFGYGINMQFSHNMAFVGVSDSFEDWYQAIRRQWRFGQKHEVNVHVFYNELEGSVVSNLKRKGEDARKMGDELSAETRAMVLEQVRGLRREANAYESRGWRMPEWLVTHE